jgi:hypothetical protein
MLQKVKDKCKQVIKVIWSYLPGGEITFICSIVMIFGLVYGAGVLFNGIVAGTAMIVSITCILLAMPNRLRKPVIKFVAKCGWQTDIVVQATLIYLGFTLGGATLAITAIFMGISYAGFAALLRWIYFLGNETEKKEFYQSENLVTA